MTYLRPADRAGALRLHLNENTGGCSQSVIDAIRQITTEEVAIYPDYAALSRECAEYLGVREAQVGSRIASEHVSGRSNVPPASDFCESLSIGERNRRRRSGHCRDGCGAHHPLL